MVVLRIWLSESWRRRLIKHVWIYLVHVSLVELIIKLLLLLSIPSNEIPLRLQHVTRRILPKLLLLRIIILPKLLESWIMLLLESVPINILMVIVQELILWRHWLAMMMVMAVLLNLLLLMHIVLVLSTRMNSSRILLTAWLRFRHLVKRLAKLLYSILK